MIIRNGSSSRTVHRYRTAHHRAAMSRMDVLSHIMKKRCHSLYLYLSFTTRRSNWRVLQRRPVKWLREWKWKNTIHQNAIIQNNFIIIIMVLSCDQIHGWMFIRNIKSIIHIIEDESLMCTCLVGIMLMINRSPNHVHRRISSIEITIHLTTIGMNIVEDFKLITA